MTHSILIVDDDADLCRVMAGQLGVEQRFTVTTVSTIAEAQALLGQEDADFDAVILDVGLPDGDGIEFCTSLRRAGTTLQIILLTGMDSDDDLVRGFEAGASNHLIKPFRAAELRARLRVQMRVSKRSETARPGQPVGRLIMPSSARQAHDTPIPSALDLERTYDV